MLKDYPYQKYMGFRYAIAPNCLGMLCAYILIPKHHKLHKKDYSEIEWTGELVEHSNGGLTFSGARSFGDEDGWWIGWDYAHSWDFNGLPKSYAHVEQDCFAVIRQIIVRYGE